MSRKPGEPVQQGGEAFLSRWARRKEEARQAPPEPGAPVAKSPADPDAPAPELPPVDNLTIDSDYRAFFHPKVNEDVRRAALKKLFNDPHFNVMDGLDVYIDDYSKSEPIPPEMLAGMKTAQDILRWAREDKEEREREEREKLERESARSIEPPAAQPATELEARINEPVATPNLSKSSQS